MNLLAKMGHDRAIAAIHHSIAQGYTGIFEAGSWGSGNNKPFNLDETKAFLKEELADASH
jgi:hypothetical protein